MAEQERQHLPKNYSHSYLLCKQQSNLQGLQTKYREQDIKFTETHVMQEYSAQMNTTIQNKFMHLTIVPTTVTNAQGAVMQNRFYLVSPDEEIEAGCFVKVVTTSLKLQWVI